MLLSDLSSPGLWETMDALRHRLNRLFYDTPSHSRLNFPPMNVWSAGDKVIVQALVAGLTANDIEIQVSGQSLTLTANIPAESTQGVVHRKERAEAQSSRAVELPFAIELDKVEAKFSDGLLTITLPRAAADMPRKITVKPAS